MNPVLIDWMRNAVLFSYKFFTCGAVRSLEGKKFIEYATETLGISKADLTTFCENEQSAVKREHLEKEFIFIYPESLRQQHHDESKHIDQLYSRCYEKGK